MKNILINGVSAKSGGGKSILTNLLRSIFNKGSGYRYIVIVPAKMGYEIFSNGNIIILEYDDSRLAILKQLYFYFFYLKRIVKNYDISLIFNLSDIIIPLKINQLFLFDWSYAVYPESLVWKKMGLFEFIYRKGKLFVFKRYLTFPKVIYAQTDSVKSRLEEIYKLDNVSILPNAVSLDNIDGGIYKDFNLPSDKYNFLCLCKYYVHKNLEIFVPLAKLIKLQKLPYTIIITIEKTQHGKAKRLLDIIAKENLNDIIINVGEVEMKHVPSLYKQSTALLLPTLLESFSGTYVEAMFHKKPIFTSNMDFAKDVCGECAIYYNPNDPNSILEAMKKINNTTMVKKLVENATLRLNNFLTWDDVTNNILKEINKNI